MHPPARFRTGTWTGACKLGLMSFPRPSSLMTSAHLLPAAASLALALAACTSSPPAHTGTAGTTGTGAAGTTGSAGTAGTGAAGTTGTAGTGAAGTTGTAGTTGAAGSTAGTTGAAGSGTAGTTGAAGSAPDGGTQADAGTPHKQFTCPPGPYPAQQMGTSMNACVGFTFAYDYVEGPTWVAGQNAFFFSNFVHMNPGGMAGGDIIKVDMNGQCSVWAHDVGTNGLAVTARGNIVAACHKTRSVTEFDIATKQPRIVANIAYEQAVRLAQRHRRAQQRHHLLHQPRL